MMKILVILVTIFSTEIIAQNTLHPKVEWKQVDFQFPNASERQKAIQEGRFVPENCLPLDTDVHYKDRKQRIFVTFPRFTEGVPVTLGTVSNIKSKNGPLIKPYPNYSWQSSQGGNCDEITSVFRVFIDQCDRIWVLDAGQVNGEWKCDPQLLAFDLKTDQLIRRYRIPKSQYQDSSIFVTPIVDIPNHKSKNGCLNTKVYMADTGSYSLLVYDYQNNHSWKITHPTFQPTSGFNNFTVEGESFQFDDGILGMAIMKHNPKSLNNNGTNQQCDSRRMFYHALASNLENSVPMDILNNETAYSTNANSNAGAFQVIGNRNFQSAAEAIDSKGNLFFGLVNPTAIACWSSSSSYNMDNIKIVARNRKTLQFASGLKIIRNRGQEELWVLTNRLQKFVAGNYNWNETNFRILSRPIDQILKGQECTGESIPPNFVFPDRS